MNKKEEQQHLGQQVAVSTKNNNKKLTTTSTPAGSPLYTLPQQQVNIGARIRLVIGILCNHLEDFQAKINAREMVFSAEANALIPLSQVKKQELYDELLSNFSEPLSRALVWASDVYFRAEHMLGALTRQCEYLLREKTIRTADVHYHRDELVTLVTKKLLYYLHHFPVGLETNEVFAAPRLVVGRQNYLNLAATTTSSTLYSNDPSSYTSTTAQQQVVRSFDVHNNNRSCSETEILCSSHGNKLTRKLYWNNFFWSFFFFGARILLECKKSLNPANSMYDIDQKRAEKMTP